MSVRTWLIGLLGGQEGSNNGKAAAVPGPGAYGASAALAAGAQSVAVATAPDAQDEEAEGLNFRTAIEAHQKWKVRLRAVVDGQSAETLDPSVVARDDQCVLGKWLHGAGGAKFARDAQFVGLKTKHAYFHVCAGQVLSLAQSGAKEKADRELSSGSFARASQEVVMDLAQMFTRLKK